MNSSRVLNYDSPLPSLNLGGNVDGWPTVCLAYYVLNFNLCTCLLQNVTVGWRDNLGVVYEMGWQEGNK